MKKQSHSNETQTVRSPQISLRLSISSLQTGVFCLAIDDTTLGTNALPSSLTLKLTDKWGKNGNLPPHRQFKQYILQISANGKEIRVKSGADPGFSLGGGALVSCSSSTPINHKVFFLQNTSCFRKPRVTSGGRGGGAHPRHPLPQIRPWKCVLIV